MTHIVLFVCVGSAGRSQMAEAIFNKTPPSGFRAISGGTRPAKKVNPLVMQALREIGINTKNMRPKPISPDMIAESDKIIATGCDGAEFCPVGALAKVEDWKIEDPKGKSLDGIRSIRDTVRRRVEALTRELQPSLLKV